MNAIGFASRRQQRKDTILETMHRLKRPICLADLAPRASEYAAYEKAFRELIAEGRILLDGTGIFRRKYYALQLSREAVPGSAHGAAAEADRDLG
jgi:hypothetical protein